MKFNNLKTEDIIKENGLTEYKAGMDFFYSEVVELNIIIYLAEKIIEFPFDVFADPDKTIFSSSLTSNLVIKTAESALIIKFPQSII